MAYHVNGCIRSNKVLQADRVTTDPLALPITLEDVKTELKMTGIDDDNGVIERLMYEAVDWIQEYCGISLVDSTVTATIEIHNRQLLPYGPVKSITTIDGVAYSASNACQFIGTTGDVRMVGYGRFTVVYNAGYVNIPPSLIGALYAYIAYVYEHRGDDLDETNTEFAAKAKRKAFPYIQTFGF